MDILEIRLRNEKKTTKSWLSQLINAIDSGDDDEYLISTIRGTISQLHDLTVAAANLNTSRRIKCQ